MSIDTFVVKKGRSSSAYQVKNCVAAIAQVRTESIRRIAQVAVVSAR
jgi:hypothetical protein